MTFVAPAKQASTPIEITQLTVGGKPVPLNTPTEVPSDWFLTASVTVKNISPKVVVFGGTITEFPESIRKPGDAVETVAQIHGQRPAPALVRPDGTLAALTPTEIKSGPLNVAPNATINFPIGGTQELFDVVTKRMGQPVTRVEVIFQTFFFQDGSKWSPAGGYAKPSATPGKWDRIPAETFAQM